MLRCPAANRYSSWLITGSPGVQGVGSGSGRGTGWAQNLNSNHFSKFEQVQQLQPTAAYATDPQWIFYGVGLGDAGENSRQRAYVMTLFSKIDAGGVVFLAGCNVALESGSSLLRDLALIAQRSVKIVAARTAVAWSREGRGSKERMIRLVKGTGGAFESYDLVGFMGARQLDNSELNNIIPSLVVPAAL